MSEGLEHLKKCNRCRFGERVSADQWVLVGVYQKDEIPLKNGAPEVLDPQLIFPFPGGRGPGLE